MKASKAIVTILKKLQSNSKKKQKCDVLFYCHDDNRSATLNGLAYSPLLDSLREEFEKENLRCISVAHPWSKLTGKYAFGEPISINRSYFVALYAHRLMRVINKLFGNRLKKSPVTWLYEKILKDASPRLIITIGSSMYLSEAARNLKIFHAEILHGLGYANRIPFGWADLSGNFLPQCVLSLDKLSTNTFSPLNKKGVIIKEIPHPFIRRFTAPDVGSIPEEWELKKEEISQYKKEILISLQWGYAGDHGENESLSGILSNGLYYQEIEKVIKNTADYIFWRFRFHPVQMKNQKKYKKLFSHIEKFISENKNCEWKESSTLPLPSIAIRCSGNITMSSSSAYELAYFGIKSLALCPTLSRGEYQAEVFNDLVHEGIVIKHSPEIEFIEDWANKIERIEPGIIEVDNDREWANAIKWLKDSSRQGS